MTTTTFATLADLAEELRAAAAKLRKAAEAARREMETSRYWDGSPWAEGIANAAGDFAGLLSPEGGEHLAALLEEIADQCEAEPCDAEECVWNECERGPDFVFAEALARVLNGSGPR